LILEKARLEADTLVKKAHEEAKRILAHSEEEIQKKGRAFEKEMSQAGRDLILSLKQEIVDLLDRILVREVRAALTPDLMKTLIVKLVDRWNIGEESQGVEVLLTEEERAGLEGVIFDALGDALKGGVVLKPVKAMGSGFRIGEKDGGFHYDLTHKAIAEMLSHYLNPRIAKFLDGVDGEI
jgi:V/A-type H+-transporting ATPase subunit E